MFGIKNLSLVAIVVLAIAGLTVASASAATPKWLVTGAVPGKEELNKASKTGKNKLKWNGIIVSCDKTEVNKGFIEGEQTNGAESIAFSTCTVDAPTGQGCTVGTITTKALESKLIGTVAEPKVEFKPSGATELKFASFKLSGENCTVKGTYVPNLEALTKAVVGLAFGEMEEGLTKLCGEAGKGTAAEEKPEHCLHFDTTDPTELLVGVEPAEFEANIGLTLKSGKSWSESA